MKKYSSNRAQKGKTAYRTPSRFKAQVKGVKDGYKMKTDNRSVQRHQKFQIFNSSNF